MRGAPGFEHEPAWRRFREIVLEFLGVAAPRGGEHPAFGALSPRERESLALISQAIVFARDRAFRG